MPSFVTPQNGDDALAEHVAQLTEDLSGLRNIPISLTGINDAAAYAQTIKNAGVGSKDCIMYAADGITVLLQVDANGVRASASGGPAAPILTTTAGSITSAMIADGTIATADLANSAVTNIKLGSDTARLNLLVNGGFEIWQRGNGPFAANGAWTADRWQIGLAAGDTLSVSRDATNFDTPGQYCAACTYTRSTGPSYLGQFVVDLYPSLRGKTITFSVRVRTSTANAVRLRANDGPSGVQNGNYHTGSGAYETLTLTYAISTGATQFNLSIIFDQSCTAYLDNAMLVVGSVPADYAPLHPADDLARCLRYYEVNQVPGGSSAGPVAVGMAFSATAAALPLLFRVPKPVAPTITISANADFQLESAAFGALALTGFSAVNITANGADLRPTVASGLVAGNATMLYCATANARLVVEANP